MTNAAVPWREAWETALYAPNGFFRSGRPAQHFRTSAQVRPFAEAVAALIRLRRPRTFVDLGAGGGELLGMLRPLLDPSVELVGVEVAERPIDLDASIHWVAELPDHIDGLLMSNEWLDNVPCDIVEMDHDQVVREVLVDPATGAETLGDPYDSPWLDQWWPLVEPGERAEVGADRDAAWADAVRRVDGMAIAIDYGHRLGDRPVFGSLRSYVEGREVDVVPDGSRDVTAHVGVDSVASAVGADLIRQRDALLRLGLDAQRPAIDLAHTDPAGYLTALGHATEVAELIADGGFGDFWWIVTDTSGHGTLSA